MNKKKQDNQSFKKSQRLLKPSEFKAVFDGADKKIHSPHLLLFVKHQQNNPRLGLAITKKKIKNASDRNWLKRQTREIFRKQVALPNCDCVLIVKKMPFVAKDCPTAHKAATKTALRQELTTLFAKLAQV